MKKIFSAVFNSSDYGGVLMLIYFLCAADLMYSFVFVSGGLVSETDNNIPYINVIPLTVTLSSVITIVLLGILRIALGMKEPRHKKLISFFLWIITMFYSAVSLNYYFRAVYVFYAFG